MLLLVIIFISLSQKSEVLPALSQFKFKCSPTRQYRHIFFCPFEFSVQPHARTSTRNHHNDQHLFILVQERSTQKWPSSNTGTDPSTNSARISHTHTKKKTSRLNRTPTSTTPSGLRTPTPPLQSCCCSAHAPKLPGSRASARTHARPEGEATGGRGAAIAAGVQRSAETFCVAAVTPRHPRSVTRPPIHPFLTHSPPAAAGGSWAGHVATQPSPRPWRARETRVPATTILRGNLYY